MEDGVTEVLLDTRALGRGWFKPPAIKDLLKRAENDRVDRNIVNTWVWELVMLELWCRNYLDLNNIA